MYAVIRTGGKQYKVQEGDVIRVEKLDVEEGSTVQFDEVLAVRDDNGLKVGNPLRTEPLLKVMFWGMEKAKRLLSLSTSPRRTTAKNKDIASPILKLR